MDDYDDDVEFQSDDDSDEDNEDFLTDDEDAPEGPDSGNE